MSFKVNWAAIRNRPRPKSNPAADRQRDLGNRLGLGLSPFYRMSQSLATVMPSYKVLLNYEENLRTLVTRQAPLAEFRSELEKATAEAVGAYQSSRDPIEFSSTLASLRLATVRHMFQIAAAQHEGNYALGIGGSIVKDYYTLATDIDFVIIAASKEDLKAAERVQGAMYKILSEVSIDSDYAISVHFAETPIDGLNNKQKIKGFDEGIFMSFMLDVQLADVYGDLDLDYFNAYLNAFRQERIFGSSSLVRKWQTGFESKQEWANLRAAVRSSTVLSTKEREAAAVEIKEDVLKQYQLATYGARVMTGRGGTSIWDTLSSLEEQKIISADLKVKAQEALRFFLEVRHLLGLFTISTPDSTKLSDVVVAELFSDGSPAFTDAEFLGIYSLEALCREIKKTGLGAAYTSPANSVEWLNELLSDPLFFAQWRKNNPETKLTQEIERLAEELSSTPDPAKTRQLNRMVLELAYESCPPSFMTQDAEKLADLKEKVEFLKKLGYERKTFMERVKSNQQILISLSEKLLDRIADRSNQATDL